jgi:hypothetical protein
MIFTVRLADLNIEIHSIYPELQHFFKDYLVKNVTADLSVSWTEEEISAEKDRASNENYPMEYLETLAALRKISELLPLRKRLLVHGAAITYDDKAYLFTAQSGTGKSTHICLWKEYLGSRVDIVNGDKPFVSLENVDCKDAANVATSDGSTRVCAKVYGTPWAGKEDWEKNRSAELNGICFLQRGKENKIRKLEPAECLNYLFNQVYLPKDPVALSMTLELADLLTKNVPLYLLECDISEEAVKCSFEGMTGMVYER